jgi:hypothetical protein
VIVAGRPENPLHEAPEQKREHRDEPHGLDASRRLEEHIVDDEGILQESEIHPSPKALLGLACFFMVPA